MNAIHELFSRMVFLRVGWALLHFLWQGAAVAALLAVALRLMRRRSPNARYLTACAAAAALAATVPLSAWLMPLPQWSLPAEGASAAPPPRVVSAPAPSVPLAAAIPPAEVAQVAPPAAAWTDRAVEALGPVLPYVVTAWMVGVALMSLWRAGGWVRVVRLKLSGRRDAGKDLSARLADLARRLGVTRPVRLMRSALATTPTVIGWLRPVLLLPASAVTGLTAEQLQAVLAHELAHVRRHDYLVNLLQTVVETLLFYHPAVWWVSARIRAERENCCDDVAAAACGGRYAYAEALVAIASLAPARPRLALAATGGSLLARVRRLLGVPDDRPGRSTRWLGGAAAMATVLCLTLGLTLTYTPAEPADGDANVVVTRLPAAEKLELSVQDGKLRVKMDYGKGKPPAILELSADGVVCTAGNDRIRCRGFRFKNGDFQIVAGDNKVAFQVGSEKASAVVADGKVQLRVPDPVTGTDTTRSGRLVKVDVKGGGRMILVTSSDPRAENGEEATVIIGKTIAVPGGHDGPEAGVARLPASRPSRGEFYVMGDVPRPGVYSLTGRRVRVKQALAGAGLQAGAKIPAGVVLIRRVDGKETRVAMDLPRILAGKEPDIDVKADDVLVVGVDRLTHPPTTAPSRLPAPRVAVARWPKDVTVMGAVQRPGVYSTAGRRVTLLQLLASAAFEPHKNKGMTAFLTREAPDGKENHTLYDIDAVLAGKRADPVLEAGDKVLVSPPPTEMDVSRVELETLRRRLGPNHRQVKEMEARLAALQAPARTGSGVGVSGDTPKRRQIEKKLSQVIPRVVFTEIPFSEVVQFLRDVSGINIMVDWQRLAGAGVDKRSPVTVQLQHVSVRQWLEKVLQSVGGNKVQFDVDEEGVITISAAPAPAPPAAMSMGGAGRRSPPRRTRAPAAGPRPVGPARPRTP